MDEVLYGKYLNKLKEELVPAMGCTEPAAVAYAAAIARETLGCLPDKIRLEASGNIIKNVKSVIVPNTGGKKGLEAAAAIGALAGDASAGLQVISRVTEEQRAGLTGFMEKAEIETSVAPSGRTFDIWVHMQAGREEAVVRIAGGHTNVVLVEKNGVRLLENPVGEGTENGAEAARETRQESPVRVRRQCEEKPAADGGTEDFMTISGIYEFAGTCRIEDVKEVIQRQIEYNYAIACEGISNDWGANVGRTILKYASEGDVASRAKAMAVAGSDARMSGCEMPVVINSGSGNQGITVSVPVIEYAKEIGSTEEELIRALVFSNLAGIHQKTGIGRLSAYCGAVSAGCAAGAGIAFLEGCNERQIAHVIVNCLAITSGIVCDGAKASCAAKIANSLDAAILAYHMMLEEQQFRDGEGIVKKGVENTIRCVAALGRDGMKETDKEILKIMVGVSGKKS